MKWRSYCRIVVALVVCQLVSCTRLAHIPVEKRYSFMETEHLIIRNKPILNREYLVYLAWNISVYPDSYPEKMLALFPKGSVDSVAVVQGDWDTVFNSAVGSFRNYTLQARFANFPLVGLGTHQVLDMMQWMTDRYAEDRLVRARIMDFNMEQKDQDSFGLEAYLAEQYQGILQKDQRVKWEEQLFVPSFRLPFQTEQSNIEELSSTASSLHSYRFGKRDFLWYWDHCFLKVDQDKLAIGLRFIRGESPITIRGKRDVLLPNYDGTLVMSDEDQQALLAQLFYPPLAKLENITDFDDYPFEEKDSLGRMSFSIIGSNEQKKPVAIPSRLKDWVVDSSGASNSYTLVFSKISAPEGL